MSPKIVVEAKDEIPKGPHNRFKATLGARVIATAVSREVLDVKVADWLSRHTDYIVDKGYTRVYIYELVEPVEIEIAPAGADV